MIFTYIIKQPQPNHRRYISDPSRDEVNKANRSPLPSASRHDAEGYLRPDFIEVDDAFHNSTDDPINNSYINTPSAGAYTNIVKTPDDNNNKNNSSNNNNNNHIINGLPASAFSNPQYFDSGFYFPHHFKKDQPISPKEQGNNVKSEANNIKSRNSFYYNNESLSPNYTNTTSNVR